jgi:small multidrug resistance pump
MIKYLFLAAAISCEVAGTPLLPASKNFTKVVPSVSLCALYLLSFYFLTFAIKEIPLAVVYATWSGLGFFCVALVNRFSTQTS